MPVPVVRREVIEDSDRPINTIRRDGSERRGEKCDRARSPARKVTVGGEETGGEESFAPNVKDFRIRRGDSTLYAFPVDAQLPIWYIGTGVGEGRGGGGIADIFFSIEDITGQIDE